MTQEDKYRMVTCELARRDFWEFLQLKDREFYSENNDHLFLIATTLQSAYEGTLLKSDGTPYKKIMLNIPPQMGKSRTLINFVQWILGKNNNERIIQCSYNDTVATDFSRYVRDGISEISNDGESLVFSDVFPDTKLKFGDKSIQRWALEGQFFNYISAGVGGSITSKGGTVRIIDDPVKNAGIALNDGALEKIWNWYNGTFLSRVSAETSEPLDIILMTRWSNNDLCGKILSGQDKAEWFVLSLEAYNKDTDSMLCDSMLNKKRYLELERNMPSEIFRANYHQEPIDLQGMLYKGLKTYDIIPMDKNGNPLFTQIRNYTDTADEGTDWLCSINYGVYNKDAYILDVFYTKGGMEITERATAEFLINSNVNRAMIESNNGGRGFARNVKRILAELNGNGVNIRWFHQNKNKIARILSNSATVMDKIYFPTNWKDKYPEFYLDVISFSKNKKNKHDDAVDVLTGIAEDIDKKTMEFA